MKQRWGEIRFWRENGRLLNARGKLLHEEFVEEVNIFSDASGWGFGGLVFSGGGTLAEGTQFVEPWSQCEALESSSWREVVAVDQVLRGNKRCLEGKCVKIFTDSKNAKQIIEGGSKNPELNSRVCEMDDFCEANKVQYRVEWVPRAMNKAAGWLSRVYFESDDGQLNPEVFRMLDWCWGPHSVDRFASHYNAQLPVFNSRVHCPGSSGVNSMDFNWEGHVNWAVPPPRMATKVISKVRKEKRGVH